MLSCYVTQCMAERSPLLLVGRPLFGAAPFPLVYGLPRASTAGPFSAGFG
jgi:hypothetical protein